MRILPSIIRAYNLCYNADYIYAEDYYLWLEAMMKGVKIRSLHDILINYRVSDNQISTVHSLSQATTTKRIQDEIREEIVRKERAIAKSINHLSTSRNMLTVVIPFLNEGDEIENTVRSVRETAGDNVDIIVVNDNSDDRFDYEYILHPYNVNYIYNPIRIGAAASKERGIQHVVTPYFLLLDAHMRFFDTEWYHTIIEELDCNNNRLLCCQSVALSKEDGHVRVKGEMGTYGAYLLFDDSDYIPGIHWNHSREVRGLSNNQIPAVMGAGYAASKQYWNLLKGYQGLVYYGCEEAYISIKSWLNGGGCYLLPDIRVGHIYRAKPPYSIVHTRMIYNYFVIIETLFPTKLRCMAHSVAIRKNLAQYKEVAKWLECGKQEIQELKSYYKRTLTKHSFDYILSINNIIEIDAYEKEIVYKQLIDIVNFTNEHVHKKNISIGLYDGLMGAVILLCEYGRLVGSPLYEEMAEPLLEYICGELNNEQPITFGKGVCGIGWGILYLQANGFLDDPMEPELATIDSLIIQRRISRANDNSIKSGIGGVMAYVVNRIGKAIKERKDIANIFPLEYMKELRTEAERLVSIEDDLDCRIRSLAMQVTLIDCDDFDTMLPTFEDVIYLPDSLPEDKGYWSFSMNSALGYGINKINQLKNRK